MLEVGSIFCNRSSVGTNETTDDRLVIDLLGASSRMAEAGGGDSREGPKIYVIAAFVVKTAFLSLYESFWEKISHKLLIKSS